MSTLWTGPDLSLRSDSRATLGQGSAHDGHAGQKAARVLADGTTLRFKRDDVLGQAVGRGLLLHARHAVAHAFHRAGGHLDATCARRVALARDLAHLRVLHALRHGETTVPQHELNVLASERFGAITSAPFGLCARVQLVSPAPALSQPEHARPTSRGARAARAGRQSAHGPRAGPLAAKLWHWVVLHGRMRRCHSAIGCLERGHSTWRQPTVELGARSPLAPTPLRA